MKVSTKSRYGLAAMVDLAEQYGKGPVALRSVAARQQVSEHYLEQLTGSRYYQPTEHGEEQRLAALIRQRRQGPQKQ